MPPGRRELKARRARSCPRTSARSGPPAPLPRSAGTTGGGSRAPRRYAPASARCCTATGSIPASAASGADSGGQMRRVKPCPPRRLRRHERSGHRANATVQRELAEGGVLGEPLSRNLMRGRENRQCNGKIEARALLPQTRGSEVDRDAPERPFQLGARDSAPYALLRLLACLVRQADDGEAGHAALEVGLHLDRARFEPDKGMVVARASTSRSYAARALGWRADGAETVADGDKSHVKESSARQPGHRGHLLRARSGPGALAQRHARDPLSATPTTSNAISSSRSDGLRASHASAARRRRRSSRGQPPRADRRTRRRSEPSPRRRPAGGRGEGQCRARSGRRARSRPARGIHAGGSRGGRAALLRPSDCADGLLGIAAGFEGKTVDLARAAIR